MKANTSAFVVAALVGAGLLAGCSADAPQTDGSSSTPGTADSPEPSVSVSVAAPDDSSGSEETGTPQLLDTVRDVDVYAFDDIIAPESLVDTSGWQTVTFGDYTVLVPAEWGVYPVGTSAEVDGVFQGTYQDRLQAVVTGGAVEDLASIIEYNTDGFAIVTTTHLAEVEMAILNDQGLSPSFLPFPTASYEPSYLLVKDGIEPWLSYAERYHRASGGRAEVFAHHIQFFNDQGEGFTVSVVAPDPAVTQTVIASLTAG